MPVLSEFLQQITVHLDHPKTHKRRNNITKRCWATSPYVPIGRSLYSIEDVRFNLTSILIARLIARRRESRETRHTVFLHTIKPMVYRRRRRRVLSRSVRDPRKVHNEPRWKHSQNAVLLNPSWEATRENHSVLGQTKSLAIITNSTVTQAFERVRLHVQSHNAEKWLFTQRSSTTTCSTHFSQKCLAWAAAARCSWAATGNCWWEFVQRVLTPLSEAPSLNNAAKEENSSQVDLRVHGIS